MANAELERLSQDFYRAMNETDPLSATMLGLTEFDGLVPDPSREGAAAAAGRFAAIEAALARIPASDLGPAERVNHAVLAWLSASARSELEHGLWEANASAAGYANPQGLLFQALAAVRLPDEAALERYLDRLRLLPQLLDGILRRYREALRDGRPPTRVGVLQAQDQLRRHLGEAGPDDPLLHPELGPALDRERVAERVRPLLAEGVRPALARLLEGLEGELLPRARPDDRVGIRFVRGGEAGYRSAVRRHTTTELGPERIHQIGTERLEELEAEWSALGQRALGVGRPEEVRQRLRQDPDLRFHTSAEIVDVVTRALERAEAARDGWFPPYRIAPCVVEEISPLEVNNAALAYYRPPADDGSRPGAHCVLTVNPEERFVYEYEALAFHESSPGHHLQLGSAQTLADLPAYRRHLDAELCAYVEGWALYSERLADEMGLYSSDLQRLGMLSFEALRACRLVVDTGMHQLGWSRQRASDFMWEHTATPRANVSNEIDRYICWPGQALAYMVGCREIRRLRSAAERRLGAGFDVRAFHGTVLGQGPVPLGVLESLVEEWASGKGGGQEFAPGPDREEPA